MLKKFIILSLVLVVAQKGFSQLGFFPVQGATFNGLGRSGVSFEGVESIYNNQAGITKVKNFAADVSFERRFNLKELDIISISILKSQKNLGTFGLMFSQFGFSKYNEQKFGLAYARKLFHNVSLGGQLDYLSLNIENYSQQHFITFEVGTRILISKQIAIGAHIFNPIKQKINEYDDLFSKFRVGLQYSPSSKVQLYADVDKTIYKSASVKLGLIYQVVSSVQLRIGSDITNQIYAFGAKFSFLNSYHVAGSISSHHELGATSSISLQYNDQE